MAAGGWAICSCLEFLAPGRPTSASGGGGGGASIVLLNPAGLGAYPLGLGHGTLHLGHGAHAELPARGGHALRAGEGAGLQLGGHYAV